MSAAEHRCATLPRASFLAGCRRCFVLGLCGRLCGRRRDCVESSGRWRRLWNVCGVASACRVPYSVSLTLFGLRRSCLLLLNVSAAKTIWLPASRLPSAEVSILFSGVAHFMCLVAMHVGLVKKVSIPNSLGYVRALNADRTALAHRAQRSRFYALCGGSSAQNWQPGHWWVGNVRCTQALRHHSAKEKERTTKDDIEHN
jgi:hypothetical protein